MELLEEIGANDPASMKFKFNEKTGDFDVQMGPTMALDDVLDEAD